MMVMTELRNSELGFVSLSFCRARPARIVVCQKPVKSAPLRAHGCVASLLRFLKLSLALKPFIDNFCPGFVLQLFPLLAFVLGSQAAGAQPGLAIEFTNVDAG